MEPKQNKDLVILRGPSNSMTSLSKFKRINLQHSCNYAKIKDIESAGDQMKEKATPVKKEFSFSKCIAPGKDF